MTVTWSEDAWTDIGGGMEITPITDDESGVQVGIMERHRCAGDRLSRGYVAFAGADANLFPGTSRWAVEQADPLTLAGSIQCRSCLNHGWIRDGRWVSAG